MTSEKPRPLVVGVAGGSGSGKTTVIEGLVEALRPYSVAMINHDAYYRDLAALPPEAREEVNFDHPDALETSLLVRHLEGLRAGSAVDVPIYDFRTHTRRGEARRVEPADFVLVEGILVLADAELRSLFDFRIFVHTDADLRFIRRLERDVHHRDRSLRSVVEQYYRTVRPMHRAFVEPSRGYADLVVAEGGRPAEIAERIAERLKGLRGAAPSVPPETAPAPQEGGGPAGREEPLRDPLTGLLDRRAFHERLREEADRSQRYGEPFSLVILDIDHFESVNDTLGPDAGDELLRWIGRLLTEHTRAADPPFRIGGEEFAVLAPATGSGLAARVADRLLKLVAEARPPLDRELRVTLSAGIAAFPEDARDADALFHRADQALRRAKSSGRNQVGVRT